MSTEISIILTILCPLIGTAIGLATFSRTNKKAAIDEGANKGVISSELGYIKAGIDDIKRKQERQDERFAIITERLAKVESKADAANTRLDRIEGKV